MTTGRSNGANPLAERARAWGVETSWEDAKKRRHQVPGETLAAILDVLGAGDSEGPPADGPLVLRGGKARSIAEGGLLCTEAGDELPLAAGPVPADLPLGYHRLHQAGGGERIVIVGPGRCHLPAGLRTWGFAVQLYSLHSARSWGIGDLGDLRELARWARGLGAGLLLLSPLHFSAPVPPITPSPYSPGSRRFRDPLYLRIDDALAAPSPPTPTGALIDRDATLRRKLDALGGAWEQFPRSAEFDTFGDWRREQGADLDAFGTYCALAEVHGGSWRAWPPELQDRHSPAVSREHARLRHRADFHVWLQWLLDRQVAAAAAELPLLHDLAIGVDPGGVDAWLQPGVLARGIHVGAPPDLFNTRGQDWGVAPFDPWRLRAAGYAPFAELLRACLRGAGGLRVDHVMGLSRLFWVPPGGSPADGAYVRYPASDLFEVLALESVRAQALIVGEDLGTVEAGVRRELAARDILSYRLLWFERSPPRRYPARALAAVTTHDLPTVAGLWTSTDLGDQRSAGTEPDERRNRALREHLRKVAGPADDATAEEAVVAAYATLAEAPSAVLVATLEDALLVEHRPNMPGTTADRWPSWSVPLPATLEEITAEPRAARIAELLARRNRDSSGP
jgi:4-alpha-glucanotransferase